MIFQRRKHIYNIRKEREKFSKWIDNKPPGGCTHLKLVVEGGLSTWKVSYILPQVFWGIRTIQNKFKYKGGARNKLASRGISVYWGDRRAVLRVTGNHIAENTSSSWSIPGLGLHRTEGMWGERGLWGEPRDASIVLATTRDRKDQEAHWQRKKKNMSATTHLKLRSTVANRQSLSLRLTSRSPAGGIM